MASAIRKNLTSLGIAACVALGAVALPTHAASAADLTHLQQVAQAASTPAAQARAKAALAQGYWDAANAALLTLNSKELENSRTLSRLHRLGLALERSNASSSAVAQLDPKEALTRLDQQIAAIRGDSATADWSLEKAPPQPTVGALKQQVSTLEGDISRRQTQIQGLQKQRDQINSQADKLAQQADAAKGRASVDDFNKSLELRGQASAVQRQIDLAHSQLTPQQADLALAKAQLQAMQDAVTHLEQQKAAMAGQWETLQKQLQSQQQAAGALVQSATENKDDTLAAQLAVLVKGSAETDALRQQVADNLAQASTQFAAAATAAQALQNQVRSSQSANGPSQAEQTLQAVIAPQAYQLQKAAVLSAYAQTKAAEADSLQARADVAGFLSPIIQKSGQAAPSDLAALAALDAKAKAARQDADKSFGEADQLFKQLDTSAVKNTATVLHILSLYSWSNLAAASGDKQNAAARLQAAKALADNAARNNIHLPALPPAVAPALTPPSTQPA